MIKGKETDTQRTVVSGEKGSATGRKVRPFSPASNALYGGKSSAPAPAVVPAASASAAPAEGYSRKSILFWILSCAVLGLGAYLFLIVAMANGNRTSPMVARQSPAPVQPSDQVEPTTARAPLLSAPAVEVPPAPAVDTSGLKWTVRIIQVQASKQAILEKIMQNADLKAQIGAHEAFCVPTKGGDVVGCVGRFASANDPEALKLARTLNDFVYNRERPFKGAMIWQYK